MPFGPALVVFLSLASAAGGEVVVSRSSEGMVREFAHLHGEQSRRLLPSLDPRRDLSFGFVPSR